MTDPGCLRELCYVIFWAVAESEMTLASSYSQIYRELRGQDAPVPADPAVLREDVLTDLSCVAGRWLLVLDNCVDLRARDEWVPRAGGGHVIVTTTDSASPPWASMLVPVTVMAVAQAVELLRKGLDMQSEPNVEQLGLLDRLARELECWPLALKLACAYLYGGYGIDNIPEYLRKTKVASLGIPRWSRHATHGRWSRRLSYASIGSGTTWHRPSRRLPWPPLMP